ncbi:hypothetical protein KY343_01970 [Candidatus Woesearchaeota archaeon]|nr:hypothetical protein [Candidatus Woesearchaeota archaeon]
MESLSQEYKLAMQKQGLLALVKQKEPKFTDTWFPYTSGQIGPYYVQSVVVENDGKDYAEAVESICRIIRAEVGVTEFDAIGGGESRDWDFSNPVAVALKKPHIKVYKDGKILGSTDVKGKRVVWVADLNNEGSSIGKKWYPTINENDGKIVYTCFYVDRREDGVKMMDELEIPNDSVVPLDENAWKMLMDIGYIDQSLYGSLCERLKDKGAWAKNMLRTDAGLEKFWELFSDPKTVAKARNVLINGYPDMQEEIADRLSKRFKKITVKELLEG